MFSYPLKFKGEIIPNYLMDEKSRVLSLASGSILIPFPNKEKKLVVWLKINNKDKMIRLDYLVLSTHDRFYEDTIRVIHLDEDDNNCDINNLMALRKSDIISKYKSMYKVENLEDIEEVWKTHKDIPFLEISNFGKIRDLKTKEPFPTHEIHGYITINCNSTYYFVHRLVAELYVENPKPDEFFYVNHLDGNKSNNNFYNLEWCNISMNGEHAQLTGLHKEYDEKTIRNICKLLSEGLPHTKISQITGVNRKYISKIYRGKTRRDISEEYNFIKNIPLKDLYNKDAMLALMKSGYKAKEISNLFKIDYNKSFVSFYEKLRRENREFLNS